MSEPPAVTPLDMAKRIRAQIAEQRRAEEAKSYARLYRLPPAPADPELPCCTGTTGTGHDYACPARKIRIDAGHST